MSAHVKPRIATHFAYPLEPAKGLGRFVRRRDRACRSDGHRPRQGAALFVRRAGEQHWVPAIRVFSARGLHAASGAARKHSGSPRSEDLPSVALNTQRALCEPVHRSFFPSPIIDISKIPCKFPANSLLPQKNSLLGIQKFPAPLRREFGCKPMDSLAEWRRKLANEPKIFKNSLQIPC